jgi:hypothetical protein
MNRRARGLHGCIHKQRIPQRKQVIGLGRNHETRILLRLQHCRGNGLVEPAKKLVDNLSLEEIAALLGHRSAKITQGYVHST